MNWEKLLKLRPGFSKVKREISHKNDAFFHSFVTANYNVSNPFDSSKNLYKLFKKLNYLIDLRSNEPERLKNLRGKAIRNKIIDIFFQCRLSKLKSKLLQINELMEKSYRTFSSQCNPSPLKRYH